MSSHLRNRHINTRMASEIATNPDCYYWESMAKDTGERVMQHPDYDPETIPDFSQWTWKAIFNFLLEYEKQLTKERTK